MVINFPMTKGLPLRKKIEIMDYRVKAKNNSGVFTIMSACLTTKPIKKPKKNNRNKVYRKRN